MPESSGQSAKRWIARATADVVVVIVVFRWPLRDLVAGAGEVGLDAVFAHRQPQLQHGSVVFAA